jgi:hypothetical protein
MNFDRLFQLVDGLIGDIASFRGLTFNMEHGVFTIDLFDSGVGNDPAFICDFVPHNAIEPISFAAVGVDELKEQIQHFVLQ